jgi:hypothetical protein
MAEKEKPKATWGQSQAAYLSSLKNKQVTVVFTDKKQTGDGCFHGRQDYQG